MNGTFIIIRKELKRVFGDRKLVFGLYILPAILMIGIYSLMGSLIGNMEEDITKHISTVYVVNADESLKSVINATGYDKTAEITYLNASEYSSMKADLEAQILDGSLELVVVQDPDFMAKVNAYKTAGDAIPTIDVSYNSTENYSSQAYSVFGSMVLNTYRNSLLAGRLGNLEVLNVFTQNDNLIVKEEKANSQFISMMLPYLITMLLFSGVMGIGVDAIAGEKERGTLASMLITPVSRKQIVVGKFVSMAILAGLSAIVYSVSMIVAAPMMGSGMGDLVNEGFGGLTLGVGQCAELLVLMISMVFMFVAIISFLAVLAKDSKTANTLVSPVYIAVVLSAMVTMFNSGAKIPTARYAIPVYGSALAIRDLCGNELVMTNFFAAVASSLVVAIILTLATAKAFDSEKIMFNA